MLRTPGVLRLIPRAPTRALVVKPSLSMSMRDRSNAITTLRSSADKHIVNIP